MYLFGLLQFNARWYESRSLDCVCLNTRSSVRPSTIAANGLTLGGHRKSRGPLQHWVTRAMSVCRVTLLYGYRLPRLWSMESEKIAVLARFCA